MSNSIQHQKSEHVQDIIDRMPQKFGLWVTGIVLSIVTLLFLFGWIIQYPDVVPGAIVINANSAPVKLVANSSGKLTLFNYKPKDYIKESTYIAVIQNAANTEDMVKILSLLKKFNIAGNDYKTAFPLFPTKVSLGEINVKYFSFINNLQKTYDYDLGNLFQKQAEGLKHELSELKKLQENNLRLKLTREKNLAIFKRMADRDSILVSEKVATEAEFDNSKSSYLNSKENAQSILNEISNTQQRIDEDNNKLNQLFVQKDSQESQMQLDVLTSFNELKANISEWELKYVFKAPMDGKIEFLKFWVNNQFVQAGEEIFTLIPNESIILGQVLLPARGAGKVKVGQDVIIKLDNYPFEEYGSIKGKVTSISLTTNVLKQSNQTNVDAYLVSVALPKALTTNYGSKLDFKFEIKGTAEIISNDRNLLERFFDNLIYVTKK